MHLPALPYNSSQSKCFQLSAAYCKAKRAANETGLLWKKVCS